MLTKVLSGVAAMALLIGGLVIMGLMTIAVAERRREIGVRRSVGARKADILVQFLLETVFVAFSGGVAGIMFGVGAVLEASRIQRLPPILFWQPFASAILVAVLIGIAFGTYPAWQASCVDPVQALRS